MTTLNQYILDKNYDSAIKRARSHPKEAHESDENGITALHWLTFDDAPLEVVRVVYESFPGALYTLNKNGNTPLDIALECASSEIVYFLQDPQKHQRTSFERVMKSNKKNRNKTNSLRSKSISLSEEFNKLGVHMHKNEFTAAKNYLDDYQIRAMNENQARQRLLLIECINFAY